MGFLHIGTGEGRKRAFFAVSLVRFEMLGFSRRKWVGRMAAMEQMASGDLGLCILGDGKMFGSPRYL